MHPLNSYKHQMSIKKTRKGQTNRMIKGNKINNSRRINLVILVKKTIRLESSTMNGHVTTRNTWKNSRRFFLISKESLVWQI
jgi:hypothetical protein